MSQPFAQYHNDIERFFCVVRMSGFMVSPRDTERMRSWYLKGIPVQVVMAGLVEGARAWRYKAGPRDKLPHSLNFYAPFITGRVRAYRAAPVPEATTAPDDDESRSFLAQLVGELDLLVLQEERPLEREVKEELQQKLRALDTELAAGDLTEDDFYHHLQLLDADTLSLYDSRLDAGRRDALQREVAALVAADGSLSARARKGRSEALRASLLRRELNLMELVP